MTQERKSVFQFCCLKRCSEDSTAFVRAAFLCEWLKGSKSCLHRPMSECLPSLRSITPASAHGDWVILLGSRVHCERTCRALEVPDSKFDPKLCPGNISTQRCPVLDRCGNKLQSYSSLGAALLWKVLFSHRVGVLCTLCCHFLGVKSFKSISKIWESLSSDIW